MLLPVVSSIIFWVLQHNYLLILWLGNLCLDATPLNLEGWDRKIYNSIIIAGLERTNVKVCRRDLEKDLNDFKNKLKKSEIDVSVSKIKNTEINTNLENELESLVQEYNILISKLLILIKEEDEKQNSLILKYCNKLQTILLESNSLLWLSICKVKKAEDSKTAGVDNICFKSVEQSINNERKERLKNSKFEHSNKSMKIKKDLPKKTIISDQEVEEIEKKVKEFNIELMVKLFNSCKIKTFRKNFVGHVVKRVWIPKLGSNKMRPLGIPTIRDRVIQTCVSVALLPFIESSSDPHSFGGRPNRSASDCVAFVCRKLTNQGLKTSNSQVHVKLTNKEKYDSHLGRKQIVRGKRLHKHKASKFRREYEKLYYIAEGDDVVKSNREMLFENYKIINSDIESCFDKIDHKFILNNYPIVDKYLYLIKAWLTAPIYGTESHDKKIYKKIIPTEGVPQGSVLGPGICNNVLNGLEYTLTHDLSQKYYTEKGKRINRKIKCIRFIDDILIIGKSENETFQIIHDKLIMFLKERGLNIKNDEQKFFVFKPGTSFSFLGFVFTYPDINLKRFKNGKYTKFVSSDFFNKLKNLQSADKRRKLLITIRPKSINRLKLKLKLNTDRNKTYLSVKEIISNVNSVWLGSLNYFAITNSCRRQLKVLEAYLIKRIKKMLYWKYSSMPKLHSFVYNEYFKENTWCDGDTKLWKINKVRVNNHRPLHLISKSSKELRMNLFIDKSLIEKANILRDVTIINNQSQVKYVYTRPELKKVLLVKQEFKCNICAKEIKINYDLKKNLRDVELDHIYPVSATIFNTWNAILNIEKDWTLIDTFCSNPGVDNEIFKRFVSNKLELRITHKYCNRMLGHNTKRESVIKSKEIKDKYGLVGYSKFHKFRKTMRDVIRLWSNYNYK